MSVKIGKIELSVVEMIFLLIFVLGFLIFYGTLVSNPEEFSTLSIISLILTIAGAIIFIILAYKGCYFPEGEPLEKFEELAQKLEEQKTTTAPNLPEQTPVVREEVKKPVEETKKELFEEDVGEDLLEEV